MFFNLSWALSVINFSMCRECMMCVELPNDIIQHVYLKKKNEYMNHILMSLQLNLHSVHQVRKSEHKPYLVCWLWLCRFPLKFPVLTITRMICPSSPRSSSLGPFCARQTTVCFSCIVSWMGSLSYHSGRHISSALLLFWNLSIYWSIMHHFITAFFHHYLMVMEVLVAMQSGVYLLSLL